MNHTEDSDISLLESQLRQMGRTEDMFEVPADYFANFAEQLSERLLKPVEKKRTVVLTLRHWSIAASIVAVLGVSAYWIGERLSKSSESKMAVTEQTSVMPDDYVMLDNDAIYAYVSNP